MLYRFEISSMSIAHGSFLNSYDKFIARGNRNVFRTIMEAFCLYSYIGWFSR